MNKYGHEKLRENLKVYFDNYIEKKLNVIDCDIMNTFNGINFMPLGRSMYLKVQCLLNYLEERVPIVEKVVVMHNDQVIWSGLEQQDISLIYNYLRDLVIKNVNIMSSSSAQSQSLNSAKFLSSPNYSHQESSISINDEKAESYIELERVYLRDNNDAEIRQLKHYYLIPYNLSRMTFFLFVKVNDDNEESASNENEPSTSSGERKNSAFKLSMLKTIDDILGKHILQFLQELSEQRSQIK